MVTALRKARRVARPDAPVVIKVWGDSAHRELEAMKAVVRPFLPAPPPDASPPPRLSEPGLLEARTAEAGLAPESAFGVRWAYEYPDRDALGRAMMAPAGIADLVGPEREPAVRRAIVEALARYRTPAGGYRIENEFHVVIARA